MDADRRRSPSRLIGTVALVFILPLLLGLYLGPRLVQKPQVGIIRLNYEIGSETSRELTDQLAFARDSDAVRAVVLVINSPGGSAADSEELFLDVLNTRQTKPVIASVDLLAASGAYYMAAAANEIYAKPTSFVGSIGVIAAFPGPVFIDDETLTTGPYKAFGGTRDGVVRQVELAKFAFLEAVVAGRGERLRADPAFLSRAEIYSGLQAQELGLIDGMLATDEAVQRAATLAGLRAYDVVEIFPLVFPEGTPSGNPLFAYRPEPIDPARLWAAPDLAPGVYYRYVELPAN